MEEISLGVPEPLIERLPDDGDDAATDMQRAVADWEARLNRAIAEADDESEVASFVVDVIARFEERHETYDELVPELRAWGQSPIYAVVWRTLYADLIAQLYDHDDLAAHVDRERNARLVEDGIRMRDP